MISTDIKTLEQIKNEKALSLNIKIVKDWQTLMFHDQYKASELMPDIIEEYANQFKHKWVSVKDRLPEKSASYLVCIPNTGMEGMHMSLANYHTCFNSFLDIRITHWMALPEFPVFAPSPQQQQD